MSSQRVRRRRVSPLDAFREGIALGVAVCLALVLAGAGGCVFDKSGFPYSDNQNVNQNQNVNTNTNGNTNSTECGDGIVDTVELCDDGNPTDGDGCGADCNVEIGWSCTRDDPSVCTTVCGDSIVIGGHEGCDDGNQIVGDGCSEQCDVEGFYACSGDPSDCTCVVYVSLTGTSGAPDGSSWSEALKTVSAGIDTANSLVPTQLACEVWVAEGTYYIHEQSNADTVTLQSQVDVYGGFVGDETTRDQRDWRVHETVLDGHSETLINAQVNHVVSATAVVGAALDGFTVTGGLVAMGDNDGAGIRLVGSDVTVANCRIAGNENADDGGGIYSEGGNLRLMDSVVTNNTSRDDGGGLVIRGVGSSATIQRCLFSGNTGGDRGGGLAVHDGIVSVVSSVFWNNTAPRGGGASLGTGAGVSFTNCTFDQNVSITTPGGSIRNDNSILTVTNSILWGGQPEEVETLGLATTVSYSALESIVPFAGLGNINLAPGFVDAPGGDFHLSPGSPCIDAADASAAPILDYDYASRVDDPATANTGVGSPPADMGAYEYQP